MNSVLRRYVAEKVIEDLRAQRSLSDDLLIAVRVFPLIDDVRSLIGPSDLPLVLDLLRSSSIAVFRFGLSLARQIQGDVAVRGVLEEVWRSASDPRFREAVIWALTQYPDTSRARHAEFFQFFLDNPDVFREELETWFGGPDEIVSGCRARLSDSKFEAKRWMYIWCLAFSPERDTARGIVARYTSDADSLTSRVAIMAMQRLNEVQAA